MSEGATRSGVDIDKLEADFEADPGNFVPLARGYLERRLARQAIRICKRGLKVRPNADEGLLTLAMAYYHDFDDHHAERTLKRALKGSPDSAVALRALGEIYLDRGHEPKAIQALMRSLEIEPRDPHTRTLLESLNEKIAPLEDGKPRAGWQPRHAATTREPARPLWIGLAQVACVLIAVVAFLVWYNQHVTIRVQIADAMKKAVDAMPRDNFDDLLEAEKHLNTALALDADDEKAIANLASVAALLWRDHAQVDRKARLGSLLAWMEAEDVPNPERFATKALLQVEEGKADEATKFLGATIDRAINKKDIFLNATIFGARAEAQLVQGVIGEAREDLSRASKFSGDSPHYQAAYAELYLREGNVPRAIRSFRDVLRQNKGHVFSNLRLAYSLVLEQKSFDEAGKILEEFQDRTRHPAEEFSPPLLSLLLLTRAELALGQGNPKDAESYLDKSLKAYDNNAEAHSLAGRLATMSNDGARAAKEFARALQADPRLPKIYFDRSESMFQLGQKADAVAKLKDFERYLKPTVIYHNQVGMLKLRMDDLQGALDEFQKGVKIDELSPDARFHVAFCYQTMGEKIGDAKDKKDQKLQLYNQARQWYEDSLILPGGERPEVYHMMGRVYLDSEDTDNAMDNMAKSVVMMQKSGEPSRKIAVVYEDIAKIFRYMGGTEGEKREKIYLAKAQGLREGKTVEQVEQEWAEREKQFKRDQNAPKGKKRHR